MTEEKVQTNKGFFEKWFERIGSAFVSDDAADEAMQERVLDVSTAKGAFWRHYQTKAKTLKYDVKDINSLFQMYLDRDLVRNPLDDLVESAFGSGYYTTVESEGYSMENKRSPPFKAKALVDDFGEYHNIDQLNVNLGKLKMIAGLHLVRRQGAAEDANVVSDDDSLDFGTGSFTIVCWIKVDTSQTKSYPRIFNKYSSPTGWYLYIGQYGNYMARARLNGTVGHYNTKLQDATFHHIAWIIDKDSDKAILYVDSVKETNELDITGEGTVNNSADLYVGSEGATSNNLDGIIDDVRIFSRALSADEVKALYKRSIVKEISLELKQRGIDLEEAT